MSKEAELIWYRNKQDTYEMKLGQVHNFIKGLVDAKVTLSEGLIECALNNIWSDSRYEEEESREEVQDWLIKNRPSYPLFNEYTLAVISGDGFPETEHRNIDYTIAHTLHKTAPYAGSKPTHSPEEIAFSLTGLRDREIEWLIGQVRNEAENALEILRDAYTRLSRRSWARLKVSAYLKAGAVPEELWNDVHKERSKAPVLSEWWLTHATGDADHAKFLMIMIDRAVEILEPEKDMPPPLPFFSSNCTNRIDLIYTGVDEFKAVA